MEKGTAEAKVTFIFFVYFIIFSSVSQGQVQQRCIAYPDTIKMVQGRKYILKCFIKGDEYSSTTTTVDGYPLLENSDGDLEYAIVDSTGEINSTGILAKNIEDRTSEELNLLKTLDKESMERISKLSSRTFGFVSTDFSNSVNGFPPTGTRNLLVLLIDFTDLAFQIAGNNFNNLMNQVNYNGTGSFRDYWVENSYNNLTINSTVRGWYRSANNLAFYGANSDGSDINPRLLVREAIDAAENEGIDFSIFDNDNDGFVDGIIVVHAGYGEEAGGGANTIWSHHWTLGSYSRTYDGVTINDYAIVPELRNNFGSNISNIGVICHEFGHSLGLPDLYDTDLINGASEGIGEWGLMGSGNWNNDGASPSNLCVWSKIFLSWSEAVLLSSPISISFSNSAQNNTFFRINTPHLNEYFLIENRQFVGFDVGLPGTGLAIWHINDSKTTTSHIDANDVNADENSKGVDLEEADGNLDLDNNTNRGDDGDLFPGSSCNLFFGDNSTPNSQTYSPVVNINKPIMNIIESGNNIRFDFMSYNPIMGPSVICSSGATFEVINLPGGVSVSWSASPSYYFTTTSGTDSTFSTAWTGGFRKGVGTITATLVTSCDTINLTKSVWTGTPASPTAITLLPDDGVCRGPAYYYQVGLLHPYPSYVSSWYWDLQSPGVIIGSRTGSSLKFYYPSGTTPGRYSVAVKAVNPCGDSSYHIEYFDVIDCDRMEMVSFNIYPNPVRDVLNIEITANDAVEINHEAITELRIYDTFLSLKKQLTFSGSTVSVNTEDLPQGVYLIQFVTAEDFLRLTDSNDATKLEALKQRVFWSKFEKIP